MNKISMVKTCLYSILYQKATRFLQHPVTTEGAIVRHNTNFAIVDSWMTVGGCSMEYKYNLLHRFAMTVGGSYGLNSARATHCSGEFKGGKGVQMHLPLAPSNVFLRTYLHESIKWLYSSGMQQQKPGTVTQFLTDLQTFVLDLELLRDIQVGFPPILNSSLAMTITACIVNAFTWPEVGMATQAFLNPNPPLFCMQQCKQTDVENCTWTPLSSHLLPLDCVL